MMAVKNKYKIERRYINNKLARSGQKNNVKFLVAHETANNNADANEHYNYFNNITFQASAHTFIDDGKILEIIPNDEKAWHVMYNQDKRVLGLGYANDNAIGPELCRTGNFKKAYDRYVWYHAYLCKKYKLQPKKHIVSHKVLDPQRRSDPQSWLNPNGITWDQFINDVQVYFDQWEGNTVNPPKHSNKPVDDDLIEVDGSWGKATTRKAQKVYGMSIIDGELSGQPKNASTKNIPSATFGEGGSNLVLAMQKEFGVPAKYQDRIITDPSMLIDYMQKHYGTPRDKKVSYPSLVVKEFQKALNAGRRK